MTDKLDVAQMVQINKAFKPSSPIDNYALFAGRVMQVRKILGAIAQTGLHAVLYGERGVGKTSLVSILDDILTQNLESRPPIIRFNCDKKMGFSELWRRILKEIQINYQEDSLGFTENPRNAFAKAHDLLPSGDISPDDIRLLFQKLPTHPIIVLDEFDRIEDQNVISLIADTIKTLSDHSSRVTLILVGVADTIEELIGDHKSIERALIQIQLPRMNSRELHEALDRCLKEAKMTMEIEAMQFIVGMSKGLPHYTHLLGLHAAQRANESARRTIVQNDVEEALHVAIQDANESITLSYMQATHSVTQETFPKFVLLACALAEFNAFGYFTAIEVKREMMELLRKPIEISAFARVLTNFSSEKRGNVLQRKGSRRQYMYRFSNPLMQPYITMKGVEQGLIDYDRMVALER